MERYPKFREDTYVDSAIQIRLDIGKARNRGGGNPERVKRLKGEGGNWGAFLNEAKKVAPQEL